jgi:hypothetical protein
VHDALLFLFQRSATSADQIKEPDMFVMPHRVAGATVALFLCAALAAVAQPAAATENDGARSNALETAAVSAGRPGALPQRTTPAPVVSGTSAMRAIEADDAVSGSEPDPDTFDRRGLEIWWQGHLQKRP